MLFIIRDNAGPVCVRKPDQRMSGSLREVLKSLIRNPEPFKKITLYYRNGPYLVHVFVTGETWEKPHVTSELRVEARAFNLSADVDHGVSPVMPAISSPVGRTVSIDWVMPFVDATYTVRQTGHVYSGGSIAFVPNRAASLSDAMDSVYSDFNKWVDATVRRVTTTYHVQLAPEEEYEGLRGLLNDHMRRYIENKDKWATHQVDWGDIGEAGIDPAQVTWAPGGRHGVIYTRILEPTYKKPRKKR